MKKKLTSGALVVGTNISATMLTQIIKSCLGINPPA